MTRCVRWLATLPSLTLLFWSLSASPGLAQGTDTKDFIVGPEDVLEVQVWDNKDLNQSVFVRPDGSWIAGDAKVVTDDDAMFRQPHLRALVEGRASAYPGRRPWWWRFFRRIR